jgi:aspartyl protease family protein
MIWALLGVLAIVLVVLVATHDTGMIGGLEAGQFAGLMTGLVVLVSLTGALTLRSRGALGKTLQSVGVWIAIALGLVAAYAYRDTLVPIANRTIAALIPGQPVAGALPGEVVIQRADDGHFNIRGTVNGASVWMMVDTGASILTLTQADAAAAGIDPARLDYSVPISTANGRTSAAAVRLSSVSLGSIRLANVEALVARPGALSQTLLGLNVLDRLQSYTIEGDRMRLRP